MSLFEGQPGLVMLFLAQVLFIVLQIIILVRVTMEMNAPVREARATIGSRVKRKVRRR